MPAGMSLAFTCTAYVRTHTHTYTNWLAVILTTLGDLI